MVRDVRRRTIHAENDVGVPELTQRDADIPTIFHITHWKAGSQWIHKILTKCVPERIVQPQLANTQFLNRPPQSGKVYPTVYMTKQQFDSVHLPSNWRRFVVIRDLRDTLVSGYMSYKMSHAMLDYDMARSRAALRSLSVEDGLLYMMEEWLPDCAAIQASWLKAGERLIRYEDLLEHDLEILEQVLLNECRLPVSRKRFREVILANRFDQLTKGRPRGHEDVTAHERKGIAGDWRNYFSERVNQAFMARYGGLLAATGYEEEPALSGACSLSLDDAAVNHPMEPTAVERLLSESIKNLMGELAEKEKVIQELHAEAERRREALEETDRVLRQERAEWAKERHASSGHRRSYWKAFRRWLSNRLETNA